MPFQSQFPSDPIPASVPKRLHERIWFWDDERKQDEYGSIIITLRPGWHWLDDVACHTIGADNVRMAVERLRDTGPCDCETCQKEKANE